MESKRGLDPFGAESGLQPVQKSPGLENPTIPSEAELVEAEAYLLTGPEINSDRPPSAKGYLAAAEQDVERLASLRRWMSKRGKLPATKALLNTLTHKTSFFDRPFVRTSLGLDIPLKYHLAAAVPTLIAGTALTNALLGTIPSQYITSAESAWVSVAAFAVSLAIKVWGSSKKAQESRSTNGEPLIVRKRI